MKPIGGYFELELKKGEEYHSNAIKLNTGRAAFEYILRAKKYYKAYLPYFTCDVMQEPIQKLNLEVEFYHIDKNFFPKFNFDKVKPNQVFVYTNYFGICNHQVSEIAKKNVNIIIDNAQAFFSQPQAGVDTFYSARKFFGVPDGAYLYTNVKLDDNFEREKVVHKFDHLIKRIEESAESGYNFFKQNNASFINQPIKKISRLSQHLLSSLEYDYIIQMRNRNFKELHQDLGTCNQLNLTMETLNGPLAYPYLTRKDGLKEYLTSKNIYVPTYWPNVESQAKPGCYELELTKNLGALPIDQRYGKKEMARIINEIKGYEG